MKLDEVKKCIKNRQTVVHRNHIYELQVCRLRAGKSASGFVYDVELYDPKSNSVLVVSMDEAEIMEEDEE